MKLNDPQWLDSQYDNRARVPDHGEYFSRWAAESAQVRKKFDAVLDIPYGDSPAERLDVFPAADGLLAPVLVFIHGGYWRSMDKADHSFIAPAFTQAGACVVVPNYGLCPAVTIAQIVMQMVRAVAWTWRHIAEHGGDPERIVVAGHSAGGHLAAMLLACNWPAFDPGLPPSLVARALSISGLFDLEPFRHAPSFQKVLRLTPEQVEQASPARLPAPPAGTLFSLVGGRESMEFLRHNELIRQAWGRERVPVCEVLPRLNHFDVLDALVQPDQRLHRLARSLLET
ncbi:alpha/beta hydrolase fold domain-containing protein [Ramlibacter sp. AW1]|uniref:Alpha/beta hydrolase fold domain-containing protein n=1 Tax=Ramlibacter aurantiacus TaxID=2801330 RepID=A0A936ZS39_9BURK|nr:alpha/beta hydrolase [Ramlibacter aurantiacus]MBL0419609.1 alpha/beta hydrolase fold domain-containing protein [Ramlibacter aurantiacus]